MAKEPLSVRLRSLPLALSAQIVPALFAVYVYQYLLQKTAFKFEYALPLMIAWGALGAGVHYVSLKRGLKLRLLLTAALILLSVGVGYGLSRAFAIDLSTYSTCQICGSVSLPRAGEACPVCRMVYDTQAAREEGYEDLHSYLIAAQITHFMPTPPDTVVRFDAADPTGRYPKDSSWHPSVSAADVLDVQSMVDRGGK